MGMEFRNVPIEGVKIGDRVREDVGDLEPLAKSIEAFGLLQPIVVQPDMRLVAGFRRLMACKLLGWSEIPAIVGSFRQLGAEITENSQRKQFEPLEVGSFVERNWDRVAESLRGKGVDTRDVFADLFACSGPHIDRCRRLYRRVQEGANRADVERAIEERGVAGADAALSLPHRPAPTGGAVSAGTLEERCCGALVCLCRSETQAHACVALADEQPVALIALPNGPCIAGLPKVRSPLARVCVLMRGHDVRFLAVFGGVPDEKDRLVFGGHDWGDCLHKAVRYYARDFEAVFDPYATEAGFWAAAGRLYYGENAEEQTVGLAQRHGLETP